MNATHPSRLAFILFAVLSASCSTAPPAPAAAPAPAPVRYDLVEINTAALERLYDVVGIGPELAAWMIRERAIRPFTGCRDMVNRVKGMGPMNAAKLSERGLRVNGEVCRPSEP